MANIKTITLGGAEQEVIISGQNCDIRNDGAEIVYASAKPNVTAGEDGVLAIPVGQAAKLLDTRGKVYLKGTGIVQICGSDYSDLVFKSAPAGGGSGGTQDDVARNMASANAASISALRGDVEDVQTVAENISNPNLLINPDFRINQRGQSEYTGTAQYTVDRWRVSSTGKITVNSDGTVTHTSPAETQTWFIYEFDDAYFLDGKGVTLSVETVDGDIISATGIVPVGVVSSNIRIASASTSIGGTLDLWKRPDDKLLLQVATPAGASVTPNWIKLELGSVATPFIPPDPATELAKCQRYYMRKTIVASGVYGIALAQTDSVAKIVTHLPVSMRALPSIDISVEQFELYDGVNSFPISTVVVNTFAENLLTLSVAATGLTIGKSYFMRAKSDATIAYSAEL